jgi:hypothetical protein
VHIYWAETEFGGTHEFGRCQPELPYTSDFADKPLAGSKVRVTNDDGA